MVSTLTVNRFRILGCRLCAGRNKVKVPVDSGSSVSVPDTQSLSVGSLPNEQMQQKENRVPSSDQDTRRFVRGVDDVDEITRCVGTMWERDACSS